MRYLEAFFGRHPQWKHQLRPLVRKFFSFYGDIKSLGRSLVHLGQNSLQIASSLFAEKKEGEYSFKLPVTCGTTSIERELFLAISEILRISKQNVSLDAVHFTLLKGSPLETIHRIFYLKFLLPRDFSVSFSWTSDRDKAAILLKVSSSDLVKEPQGLKNVCLPVDPKAYFQQATENYFTVPVSSQIWARNVLKLYHPGTFFVCVRFPETGKSGEIPEAFLSFFDQVWNTFPNVRFFLFDFSVEWSKALVSGLPNVIFTKMLGHTFLEEFALLKSSDMYIGKYDEHAMGVIGTAKPFLLLGPESANGEKEETGSPVKEFSKNPRQKWIVSESAPETLFFQFKAIYEPFSGRAS